jgi:predicted dehydrogenase
MHRVGVIGCGAVSGYGHLPAIAASRRWQLAAVADVNAGRMREVTGKYAGAKAYSDYHALLAHPGLEAVVVATHLDAHHDVSIAAMERGLHVLCEKPMASSLAQCESMVRAAEKHGRLLVINFNGRSGAIYARIKSLIDAGTVGPPGPGAGAKAVRVVRFVYNWSAHQWQPPERLHHFMMGGGPVMDSAVHFFDATRWFTGQEFTRIEAAGVRLPPYEHPQHVAATCRLSGGAIAAIEVGWLYCKRTKDQAYTFQIDVIGDDGVIAYDMPTGRLRTFTRDASTDEAFTAGDKGFDILYERFADSVEAGRVIDLASGVDGLRATEASLRALEATR